MAEFFVGLDGRRPVEMFLALDEVFNLDDQLAAHRDVGAAETEIAR
jgi:L-rhamnose mutarotase